MTSSARVHGRDEPSERGVGPRNPPAPLADRVAALWAEHLDGRRVGPDDDFFALGGNSLIGIRIIDRLAVEHGVMLSVRAFYLAQTPAGVAELIERERAAS